jgi:hypothetical protein
MVYINCHNPVQGIICFTVSDIGLSGLSFIELIKMKAIFFFARIKIFRSEMVPLAVHVECLVANPNHLSQLSKKLCFNIGDAEFEPQP